MSRSVRKTFIREEEMRKPKHFNGCCLEVRVYTSDGTLRKVITHAEVMKIRNKNIPQGFGKEMDARSGWLNQS